MLKQKRRWAKISGLVWAGKVVMGWFPRLLPPPAASYSTLNSTIWPHLTLTNYPTSNSLKTRSAHTHSRLCIAYASPLFCSPSLTHSLTIFSSNEIKSGKDNTKWWQKQSYAKKVAVFNCFSFLLLLDFFDFWLTFSYLGLILRQLHFGGFYLPSPPPIYLLLGGSIWPPTPPIV